MMPLPTAPNTTCDIFRAGHSPLGDPPDVLQAPCILKGIYVQGLERGEGDSTSLKYTHIILVDWTVDIRDDYSLQTIGTHYDTVYIPDKTTGTIWNVVFVEMVDIGLQAYQHKRVYLTRQIPTYPTINV